MPIYAYRCESCGHAKDVLQKMSDAPLTTCPACGADTFKKQLTAAGFQLKGSGWYVTDFRGGNQAASTTAAAGATGATGAAAASDTGAATTTESSSSAASGGDAPAAGCGTSCACH